MSQAIGENGVCGVLAVTLAATAKCRGLETVTTQGQKGEHTWQVVGKDLRDLCVWFAAQIVLAKISARQCVRISL